MLKKAIVAAIVVSAVGGYGFYSGLLVTGKHGALTQPEFGVQDTELSKVGPREYKTNTTYYIDNKLGIGANISAVEYHMQWSRYEYGNYKFLGKGISRNVTVPANANRTYYTETRIPSESGNEAYGTCVKGGKGVIWVKFDVILHGGKRLMNATYNFDAGPVPVRAC